MSEARELADKLLDAQVAFILGEVTGDRLTEVVERDVHDVLDALDGVPVAKLVDRDAVKATAGVIVDRPGGSAVVREVAAGIGQAIYHLTANDEHRLGDIVEREHAQAVIRQVLRMRQLHEQVLRTLSESPMVATVASWFVTRLVSDVMQQNRERAEKLPGMSSLLSLGDKAANKVRGATSRHLDEFLGDMAGRGTQAALRRVTVAIEHTMAKAPLEDAALEIWDLLAADHISGLKKYLSADELGELSALGFDVWLGLRNTEYFRALLDAAIDVFFDAYGDRSLPALLDELDVSRDDLVQEIRRHAPSVVAALQANGRLEALIRARLEPFFHSDEVLKLLG